MWPVDSWHVNRLDCLGSMAGVSSNPGAMMTDHLAEAIGILLIRLIKNLGMRTDFLRIRDLN